MRRETRFLSKIVRKHGQKCEEDTVEYEIENRKDPET
jgi:hypothetical protein